jgi:hypothetical protein
LGNPWQEQHAAAETVFQDGDSRMAASIVANEYIGAPGPLPCDPAQGGCGGTAHYKATIGARKCTSCGALWDSEGKF